MSSLKHEKCSKSKLNYGEISSMNPSATCYRCIIETVLVRKFSFNTCMHAFSDYVLFE